MASAKQCGNCGKEGHFRSRCPDPKNKSLEHWSAAKAQFRKENPDVVLKLQERRNENAQWKMEGHTISFPLLNHEIGQMLQTMYEMDNDLDVLGRPDDWERVNKKLDANLPYIRELANIGKGFISSGRLRAIAVDGDIFVSRLDDLQEIRDRLVQRVKSFVNGKLGKLARANHGKDPVQLLCYIYENFPPKREFAFDPSKLNSATIKNQLKKALLFYHPDKQAEADSEWKCLCEGISRCITNASKKFK